MSTQFKNRPVAAYYPMWHSEQNWETPAQSRLANIPQAINIVILSFVDPAKHYSGNLTMPISDYFFEGEGKALSGGASLTALKQAIATCKKQVSGRKVLVSAGGEIGGEFTNVDFESLALLVATLDLDGLDLDYEPAGGMTETAEQIAIYQEIIIGSRLALDKQTALTGKKYLLTCAPTGVGILGEHEQKSEFISVVSERLKALIPKNEQADALRVGAINDDPASAKSCALSVYNFDSTGQMADVFLQKIQQSEYLYVGNMIDIVIYQAYNMGSANLLGRVLCYESYRRVSELLQKESGKTGYKILHGSHIGQEAFPRFSHTLPRLTVIYRYICKYGRVTDGASFWAYGQDPTDKQPYLPAHGMGYNDSNEVFHAIATLHDEYATVAQ